jgi:hypothetical protein
VKSVVQFPFLRLLRLFAANQHNSFSMNHLQLGDFAALSRFGIGIKWPFSIGEIREIRGAIPFFAPFAPFRGNSSQVTFHEQLTIKNRLFESRPIKPDQVIF